MENKNFENALYQLEIMTQKIKGSDTSLEESIKCYEEGMKYYNLCNDILNSARQQIQIFSQNGGKNE